MLSRREKFLADTGLLINLQSLHLGINGCQIYIFKNIVSNSQMHCICRHPPSSLSLNIDRCMIWTSSSFQLPWLVCIGWLHIAWSTCTFCLVFFNLCHRQCQIAIDTIYFRRIDILLSEMIGFFNAINNIQ